MIAEPKLPVPATSDTPKKHFVNLNRKVVIHRMETAECLDDRLFWAMVLWSRCGPSVTNKVVIKDAKGWVHRDQAGNEVPAKLTDLANLLGLDPQKMKAPISRAAARLEAMGSIRFGEQIPGASRARVIYIIEEPTLPKGPVKLPVPATWSVGKITITADQLPRDEVARTRAIAFLDDASTRWKSDLKALRTSYHRLLEHAVAEGLILISLNSSISREAPPPPTPPPAEEPAAEKAPPEPPKPEEEEPPPIRPEPTPTPTPPDTFGMFKASYPKHRLDEAKAKSLFKALTPATQQRALARLLDPYLTCDRWQDANGQWIPLASTFLRDESFDADPPPRLEKNTKSPAFDDVLAYMREQKP